MNQPSQENRDTEPASSLDERGRRVFVLDNYDSFTYNLVQYLGELGAEPIVYRNDEISVQALGEIAPDLIVISPGPGTPSSAGISIPVVREYAGRIPILGVCLGHQAIGEAFGGVVSRAAELMHGKTSLIYHRGAGLFEGLENPFEATRYHSLIVERETLPACLEVTAWTESNIVMGVRHRRLAVDGVQFHPESIMTAEGKALLRNFLCSKH
jgi:anthranilate synthase/aminodeoxychorismate synthase-like glutamine amidotransferase